jgi:hypothetical protein
MLANRARSFLASTALSNGVIKTVCASVGFPGIPRSISHSPVRRYTSGRYYDENKRPFLAGHTSLEELDAGSWDSLVVLLRQEQVVMNNWLWFWVVHFLLYIELDQKWPTYIGL